MSLSFKKKRPIGVVEEPEEVVSLPRSLVMGTVRLVEIVGSIAALSAELSDEIIDYEIPDGYGAELIHLGIMPDFHAADGSSRLLDTEIGYDGKLTGIKFLTNHLGMNALPYGDRLSKQPMRLLGTPMKKGSLTPKLNDGMKVQAVVTAGDTDVEDTIRARMQVLLYPEEDAVKTFGVGISKLATIVGGVQQAMPTRLFSDYELLESATAGKGQWEDAYSKDVTTYEQIQISHIGIKPHANSLNAKLYGLRNKKEFPEYDPYWTIAEAYNSLPFGDDDDYMGPTMLPDVVAAYLYQNTTMSVKVRDDSAIIPAEGMAVQLFGQYTRVS